MTPCEGAGASRPPPRARSPSPAGGELVTADVEARAIELEAYDNNSGLSIIVHDGNPGERLRLQVSQFLLGKHDTPPLLLLPLWFDGQRSQQAHGEQR
jgi:hypothetical protein